MRLRALFAASLSALTLAGCAASKAPPVSTNEPSAGPRWTGSLQPVQQRSGALRVTGQNRSFGTVTLTRSEGRVQDRLHVTLSVAVPSSTTNSLRWAIIPDRCGSGDLPLIGFEQFPLIEIGTNGRGQVEADLPLALLANNSYHVNVYDGGQQLDNVISCANLKVDDRAANQ
jgi:hypothetical protein